MEAAPTEELLRALEVGSNAERRRAAMIVGHRGRVDAFDILVHMLADPDVDVQNGAALGLMYLGDASALEPILDAIPARKQRDLSAAALLFAAESLDALGAADVLAYWLRYGNYLEALHSGQGLRYIWDDLDTYKREAIEASLGQRLEDDDIEEWQADWIDEVLTEGNFTPEDKAHLEGRDGT